MWPGWGPCHAPAAPDPSGAADITASGLISRPAAASRFLSNLCAGKAPSWALVRGRSPRVSGSRPTGLWATRSPKNPSEGPRGAPSPLHPRSGCRAGSLPVLPQEHHVIAKGITALGLPARHGALQFHPGLYWEPGALQHPSSGCGSVTGTLPVPPGHFGSLSFSRDSPPLSGCSGSSSFPLRAG